MDADIARRHAQLAEIAMLADHEDRAISAIRRAFEADAEQSEKLSLSDSVAEVCSVRMTTILRSYGIETIEQLVAYTPQGLANLHQISWKTVSYIQDRLERHGFRLAQKQC